MLYDVLNFTTLDGQMDSFDTSERALAHRHLKYINPGKDLVILDRGYPSLPFMFELHQQGINYCMRMKNGWWLEIRNMLKKGQKDKIVTFKLPAKDKDLLVKYGTSKDEFKCRLIVIDLPGGETEVLCTSVLKKAKLPYDSFSTLYHYRWNIEEGYKLYKSRSQMEAFSGKTALSVKQDFYARIFMMSTMAVMAFPIEELLRKEQENTQNEKKHKYKINRTNALSMIKEMMAKVFINKMIQPALKALDDFLKATTEVIRPGRKFKRRMIKKKPPSPNYKQL